jgi:hypothetical protein
MTPKQVKRELARLEREYYKGLDALCDKIRTENVIPYMIRKDAKWFCAGMGSWSIDEEASSHYSAPSARFPKRLYAMLDARDIRGQDLGSQMRDFKRKP